MRNQKKQNKLFVVRKFVLATSAREAIRKEKLQTADEVWIDEDFKKGTTTVATIIGFKHGKDI